MNTSLGSGRGPTNDSSWWARGRSAGVQWGFTCRRGGVSRGVYASANVGTHVGDDPAHVAANRARIAADLGVPNVQYMNQVHEAHVETIARVTGDAPTADAMITATPGAALAVMVADCVPVLAWTSSGAAGVAHAGRPGMMAGVAGAMVRALAELAEAGSDRDPITVVCGPSICPRCYEVPREMVQAAGALHRAAASVTAWGTPAVDVAAGVISDMANLADRGVHTRISSMHACTHHEPDLFSYRRDGVTGRFAGYVVAGGE